MSGKKNSLHALFSLENNISAENIVEAQREALLQQARRLDALALALASKPSKTALRTLAEETLSIRKDLLSALEALIDRCRPALTAEQYLVATSQVAKCVEKSALMSVADAAELQAEPLELMSFETHNTKVSELKASAPERGESNSVFVTTKLENLRNPAAEARVKTTDASVQTVASGEISTEEKQVSTSEKANPKSVFLLTSLTSAAL